MSIDDQNDLPRARPTSPPMTMQASGNADLPPHPLDKRWFAHVEGKNYGPYTGHQIKQMVSAGQVRDSDFLCPEGGAAWTQAKNDPLLGALFRTREQEPQISTISGNQGTVVQVT